MFNSTILDVALGMIFIYLLLSLMCSAANEIIELLLKKRAIDLERGIRELLVPGTNSGTPDIVQNLYNHALVNNLFGRTYEESRIGSKLRRVLRSQLPSYIPARSFALALMDLVGTTSTPSATAAAKGISGAIEPDPPKPQPPSGASGATVAPALQTATPQVVVNLLTAKGEEATPMSFPATKATAGAPVSPTAPENSLTSLREAIARNRDLSDVAQRALITLVDASGNDIAKVRENIENWYNASMDRVSSWYKRRAQITIFILGLFVAITVNVDTIAAVKRLSTDKALRESLVAASDAYARANAPAPAAAAEPSPSPTATPRVLASPCDNPNSAACKRATDQQKACEEPNSAECQRAKDLVEACKDNEDSPKCKYLINLQQIQGLGLPIGWDDRTDPKRNFTGWTWVGDRGGWWDQLRWHWLGWFLTALALSLGAPFWFDLLNKFIVIRSAVKPHEKSPEEESKD